MNFIVTPAGIRDMVYDTKFQEAADENSLVFVLYESDDIVRVADLALLMDSKASISYICAPSRDDKLLCIGAIKVRMNCMIFDKELNVEMTYFDRIEQMCNIISSGVSDSEKKVPVTEIEDVTQKVNTQVSVEDTVESGNDESNHAENQESESDSSSESENMKSANVEKIQDLSSENMDSAENKVLTDDTCNDNRSSDDDEDNVQKSESHSEEFNVSSDASNLSDVSDVAEQDDDIHHDNTDDDVSESFDAAPDGVEEPDVDSMLEEKERDSIDDEVSRIFESGHESEGLTESADGADSPLPEGTKKHPFDTRNSNGMNNRQQAVYNIVRMNPKITDMSVGEYMDAIISIVTLTDDESLIEKKICELENGSIIWTRIKDCLDDIREAAK